MHSRFEGPDWRNPSTSLFWSLVHSHWLKVRIRDPSPPANNGTFRNYLILNFRRGLRWRECHRAREEGSGYRRVHYLLRPSSSSSAVASSSSFHRRTPAPEEGCSAVYRWGCGDGGRSTWVLLWVLLTVESHSSRPMYWFQILPSISSSLSQIETFVDFGFPAVIRRTTKPVRPDEALQENHLFFIQVIFISIFNKTN